MATVNKTIDEKGYLLSVYRELADIKVRIHGLRSKLAETYGNKSRLFMEHDEHLRDMADYIDWKLQVLEKGTSFDWKAAGEDVENTVSVREPERLAGPELSGGYVGG